MAELSKHPSLGEASAPLLIRDMLQAAALFQRSDRPDLYRHVYPHSHATAKLIRSFVTHMGYLESSSGSRFTLEELELGAYLHDIGKYLLDGSLILKPGPLTEEERAIISMHPVYGAQIICGLAGITETVRQAVLYHHEHWDGSGYPEGLRGEEIPQAARLTAVVDVYTSLRGKRSYKAALNGTETSAIMRAMVGRELDPEITHGFLRFIAR